MHKLARLALATVLVSVCATFAAAGDLKLTLNNGRVTLIAQDVPLRQILDEWARVGKTTIVNGDKLSGPPLTLELVDRPEREVLDVLLRSASGYIVAQKDVTAPGASVFDKVATVTVNGVPAHGAWYWERSSQTADALEAHYRLANYWPAHATIHVNMPIAGLWAGRGLVFANNLTLTMRTGAAQIVTTTSVPHATNAIDVMPLLVPAIREFAATG